jgi:hypothetical protein
MIAMAGTTAIMGIPSRVAVALQRDTASVKEYM